MCLALDVRDRLGTKPIKKAQASAPMTLVNIVSISYPNRTTIASMMIAAMTAPKPAACFLCFDSAKAAEIGAHHRPRAKCIGPTNSGSASSIRPMTRGEKRMAPINQPVESRPRVYTATGRVRGSKRTSGGTSSAVFARWSKIAGPEAASRPCNQPLTLPELRPTFGRKLLDRERGSARHCGLDLLAHLSLGRSGTPLRGGGVLFRHAASLSGMSQLTACAISTSQGTRSGSGRGMRPSANALASSTRFWGKVQGAGRSPALVGQPSPLGSLLK